MFYRQERQMFVPEEHVLQLFVQAWQRPPMPVKPEGQRVRQETLER